MKFLKITTIEGKTEYLNLDRVLSIQPNGDRVKILMGAGLFWWADRDSMQVWDMSNKEIEEI